MTTDDHTHFTPSDSLSLTLIANHCDYYSYIRLIAHDKDVYDIAFACGKDVFSTAGGDGSVRMFDLRSLEHSTILYEGSFRTSTSSILAQY